MQTLQEIFNEIGNLTDFDYGANDKGGKIHTYLETYDKMFYPFRDGCTFMEIGLATGDSIKLWNRYFSNSKIIGVDISVVFSLENLSLIDNDNVIEIIEGDATKPDFISEISDGTLDICIDDGDHGDFSQITTFNLLKPKMAKGSLYILEDVLNLEISGPKFHKLHDNCEIIDMRGNGRFDNVLVIFRM